MYKWFIAKIKHALNFFQLWAMCRCGG